MRLSLHASVQLIVAFGQSELVMFAILQYLLAAGAPNRI